MEGDLSGHHHAAPRAKYAGLRERANESASHSNHSKMPGKATTLPRSRTQPPRDYFSRREQYRLLVLVSMLMFVLIAMNEARKPQNWRWLWNQQLAAQATEQTPVDTRLPPPTRPALPIDGFTTPRPTAVESSSPKRRTSPSREFLPGITPELLSTLEDNTVLRSAENQAWLTMFRLLQQTTQSEIEAQSIGGVGFVQLFRQTDVYRGHLVTTSGTIRRIEKIEAWPNELGLSYYYRWILKPEGGSNSPIVVYSLEMPDQLSVGDDLRHHASFTGFCYKRWAYLAGDGTRIAPLLLAKTASWSPPAPTKPELIPSRAQLISIVAAVALLAVTIAVMVYRVSSSVTPTVARVRSQLKSSEHLELSDQHVRPSVQEALTHLSAHDYPAAADDS